MRCPWELLLNFAPKVGFLFFCWEAGPPSYSLPSGFDGPGAVSPSTLQDLQGGQDRPRKRSRARAKPGSRWALGCRISRLMAICSGGMSTPSTFPICQRDEGRAVGQTA